MMPRFSGMDVLRRVRKTSALPVLMLTAKGDDTDRVEVRTRAGCRRLRLQAMHASRELTARLRAILRRTESSTSSGNHKSLVVGALVMWPEQRRAEWQAERLPLTSTEYSLLEVLARNAGHTVSKTELSEHGLGPGRWRTLRSRSVDVHLSSIRHKIGTLSDGRSCIQTVFRKGYQLIKE